MKLSQNFTKTIREAPTDETSKNAQLLIRAGYVHKTMAGVYSYLPLGLRMIGKIENIVRKNLNQIGGQEILMNSLHPKEWWLKANRWDNVDILFKLNSQTKTEYALACSHEEQVTPIVQQFVNSWKDLPEFSPYILESDIRDTSIAIQNPFRVCLHQIIYCKSTDKYLVIDNKASHSCSLFDYYPVGGGIEKGETHTQALYREFEEETGQSRSKIISNKHIGDIHQQFPCPKIDGKFEPVNKNIVSSVYYIEVESFDDGFMEESLASLEKEITKWVTLEELKSNILPAFEFAFFNYKTINYTPSYPLCAYQIQTKFRDELRAKSGLLRGREFRMKDMYDFHSTKESADNYYELVKDTYYKIYEQMGLKSYATTASGGIFTTNISHEFQVECDAGEDWIYKDSISGEVYNEEMAPCQATIFDYSKESMLDRKDIEMQNLIGVEAICKEFGINKERTTKTIFYQTRTGKMIAVVVRGDRSINEAKLQNISKMYLDLATEETVLKNTGSKIGYAGVVNLSADIEVFWDTSTQYLQNFETGTNKTGFHSINVCFGRDVEYPKQFVDISEVQTGDKNPITGGEYSKLRTAEVGNIFKLDDKYTKAFGVTFVNRDNKPQTPLMNCHGIGTSRCMAILAEIYSDEKGLKLPNSVAPFQIHLVTGINDKDDAEINNKIMDLANRIYNGELKLFKKANGKYGLLDTSNINQLLELAKEDSSFDLNNLSKSDEILWDDRGGKTSIGEKLKDADLIGCPTQIIISKKALENRGLEVIDRASGEKFVIGI
jgi:prolyl-tRNA synthetase